MTSLVSLDHPYFSEDNMRRVQQLVVAKIEDATGQRADYPLSLNFVQNMHRIAVENMQLLSDPPRAQDLEQLNETLAAEAARSVIRPEASGRYDPHDRLYQPTRNRDDPQRDSSAITLAPLRRDDVRQLQEATKSVRRALRAPMDYEVDSSSQRRWRGTGGPPGAAPHSNAFTLA